MIKLASVILLVTAANAMLDDKYDKVNPAKKAVLQKLSRWWITCVSISFYVYPFR